MPFTPGIDATRPMPEIRGYRLLRVLNHGSMSTVYLAEQLALSRQVAIKVMAPQALSDEVSRRRFENEVRTVARLEHPHVVRIHELGRTADGLPYFAMPYLARGHLGQRSFQLEEGGVDEERVIAILRALLSALEYAHARGVVHRDVKAENVLFDDGERPLLADFGVALRRGYGPRVTAAGLAVGSTAYMAPEQARGEDVDGRADLYSLGVLVWEMLTGELPFRAADALSMAVMHAQDPIPRLPAHLRHWQRFMHKALSKRPVDRFADVAAMSAKLTQVERRRSWPRVAAMVDGGRQVLRQVPQLAWASSALVVVLAAGGLLARDNGGDGFLRAGVQAEPPRQQHDPIAAMLQPLPEAPVQNALDEARGQIARRNLTTPDGDNAYASVMRAWDAEPGNSEAQRVVAELTTALGRELLDNLRRGRDARAKEYFAHVQRLGDATDSRTSEARQQLERDIAAQLQERVAAAARDFDRERATRAGALAGDFMLPPPLASRLVDAIEAIPRQGQPLPGNPDAVLGEGGVAIARRPVSRAEYARFAAATARGASLCRERASLLRMLSPRDWRDPGFPQDPEHPVVCVSLADAQAYAHWLGERTGHQYRLPSLADSSQTAAEIDGPALALWQLDCGDDCNRRAASGTSWRSDEPRRMLDTSRGYDDVGFRLVREL